MGFFMTKLIYTILYSVLHWVLLFKVKLQRCNHKSIEVLLVKLRGEGGGYGVAFATRLDSCNSGKLCCQSVYHFWLVCTGWKERERR